MQYVPWLKTRDVPSRGTSSTPPGIVVKRPYHLLSELEAIYFYLIERKPSITDIREQWPILDIDRTIELCSQHGIRHAYRATFPEPFTIDFLITELIGDKLSYRAASIKTPEDASNPEVRLRLTIEYEWCRERGIPWTLVDTSAFNKEMLSTLRFMRSWFSNRYQPNLNNVERFSEQFITLYRTNVLLGELIQKAAKRLHLTEIDAQNMFRYCAWTDRISISLKHILSLNKPLIMHKTNDAT